jgi:hypothetical protein
MYWNNNKLQIIIIIISLLFGIMVKYYTNSSHITNNNQENIITYDEILYFRYGNKLMEVLVNKYEISNLYGGLCSDNYDINDVKYFVVKNITNLDNNEILKEINIKYGYKCLEVNKRNKTYIINEKYYNNYPIITFTKNKMFAIDNMNILLEDNIYYDVIKNTKNNWITSDFRCEFNIPCGKRGIYIDYLNITNITESNGIESIVEKNYDCRNKDGLKLMREIKYKRNISYKEEIENYKDCIVLINKYKNDCIKYVKTKNVTIYSNNYDNELIYNNTNYTDECVEIMIKIQNEFSWNKRQNYIDLMNEKCV